MRVHLESLRHAGGKLAPLLHSRKLHFCHPASLQRLGQQIRRRHRVLDRQIDAHAARRRHGMRGVADAQQAREDATCAAG